MQDIVVTVNLRGTLTAPVKHTTKQTGIVDVSPLHTKPHWIKRTIKHTDRESTIATRVFPISGKVVKEWVSDEVPYWIKPQVWKKLNTNERLMVHLTRFDEGYGVSYQ